LPETGGEVDLGEDGAPGPVDVTYALANIFHRVFVHVGVGIQSPEVLHEPYATISFWQWQRWGC
jgi:hypothetical protein